MVPPRVVFLLGVAPLLAAAPAAAQPFVVGGDSGVDPAAYEVRVFASGLDFPLGMLALDDGSILVGESHESFPGSSFLNSVGEILRYVDAEPDGVADGPGLVLASGLDAITSLRRSGDLVFAATGAIGTPRIEVLRLGAAPTDPLVPLGSLDLALPLPWSHLTLSLAARERPGEPGVHEVYFNLGSRADSLATSDLVTASGLWSGSLQPDSIYRLVLDDTGPAPTVQAVERIASGLRNAFGIAFDPASGDLLFQDNGMNGENGGPVSADELDRLPAAQIGGPVEDFGFPDQYVEYPSGAVVGSGGILPLTAFLPLPNGDEAVGAVEVAPAPRRFDALAHGIFVAFHGADAGGPANALAWVDPATGAYFHFVAPGQPGVGHFDGLLATDRILYVSDLTDASGLATYGTGSIYTIRKLPVCDDRRDNDADGTVDWAGLDLNGDGDLDDPGDLPPDPQCNGNPEGREQLRCGAGIEGVLLAPLLAGAAAARRRRSRRAAR